MSIVETELPRSTFAGGEVSQALRARADLAKHLTGVAHLSNLAVLFEGGLTRCPGTQFIGELKTMGEGGTLGPFKFSATDAYNLVFNGQAMRLTYNGGIVESVPGVPFEMAVPWLNADLPNLYAAQAGNALYVCCKGHAPRKLTRVSHTNWTIEQYSPVNGPVDMQNVNQSQTISASDISGNITLTANHDRFSAGEIGQIYRLDESNLSLIPLWRANEALSLPTETIPFSGSTNIGNLTGSSGLAGAFDGSLGTFAEGPNGGYVGKTFASDTRISSASIYPSFWSGQANGATVTLYGKTGATPPVNATDGQILWSGFVASGGNIDVMSSDPVTLFRHIWVRNAPNGVSNAIVYEVSFKRNTTAGDVYRRYQGKVYQALAGTNTGVNPPTHDEGDVLSQYDGVYWRYLHSQRGYVRITAVTNAQNATGAVLSRLPESIIAPGTYRWAPPAWSVGKGWPEVVQVSDRGLIFFRDNYFWRTRPNSDTDFEISADPENPDTAIVSRITLNSGGLPSVKWAATSSGVVAAGALDNEVLIRAPQAFEPWTATNIRALEQTDEGSAAHMPASVDGGIAFINKSRDRLSWFKFNALADSIVPEEITKASRDILSGAMQLVWQKDPRRILWIRRADGLLIGCTFFLAEKVIGFFRRPFVNGLVEAISVVPNATQSEQVLELIVRRTINGGTKRYIERMRPFFKPLDVKEPTAAGAWFLDCAIRYSGAPATTLSGLSHLEGETVGVFADGAPHLRRTVSGGAITLDRPVTDAVIGLPQYWEVESLPCEGSVRDSRGASKLASHLIVDRLYAAGGKAVINNGEPEDIMVTGTMNYGGPVKLETGPSRPLAIDSPSADELIWKLKGGGFEDTLPFTILGVTPLADIEV